MFWSGCLLGRFLGFAPLILEPDLNLPLVQFTLESKVNPLHTIGKLGDLLSRLRNIFYLPLTLW